MVREGLIAACPFDLGHARATAWGLSGPSSFAAFITAWLQTEATKSRRNSSAGTDCSPWRSCAAYRCCSLSSFSFLGQYLIGLAVAAKPACAVLVDDEQFERRELRPYTSI